MDSLLIGNWIDDLDFDDLDGFDDIDGDDDVGELIAELLDGDGDEIGRRARRRRIKARRASRKARKAGLTTISASELAGLRAAKAAQQKQAFAQLSALQSGSPQTAGQALATSGQRIEYLAFGAQTLDTAVGSAVTLIANVQRAIQPRRIIVSMVDQVNGTDMIWSGAISKILVGVRPVFNSVGDAPAEAFSARAVGVGLLSDAAMTGNQVSIDLRRIATVTNPTTVTAMALGVSAQ